MVVIDEAYFEFSGVTVIPWIRRHSNLIVTRTFSKAAGLAGLRLGCIFVNRELAATMRKAQSPYPVNAAALVAAKPLCAIAHSSRAPCASSAGQARTGTRPLALGYSIFSKRRKFSADSFWRACERNCLDVGRKGILVRDRSSDFGGEGYVRVTFGTLRRRGGYLRELKAIL